MAGHIATAGSVDWCTPTWLVEKIREAFRGEIDLDPCSNAHSLVAARRNIVLPEDGLEVAWGRGRTYANPPFGTVYLHKQTKAVLPAKEWEELTREQRAAYDVRRIGDWTAKSRQEHEAYGAEVAMLMPAAVETRHWHEDVWPSAAEVAFFRRRLHFAGPDREASKGWCAPMPCALVYWGHRAQTFRRVFSAHAHVVRP